VDSARRCSAIVRRIQTFGRPIDPTQTERVDLNQVIRDTVDITHPKWRTAPGREGRVVQIDLDLGDILPIQSIGSAWEEIFSNLIFNAVDAMPEGGTIALATRQEGGQVLVDASDTGTGMDEETQRRVFEPFFTTKTPDRGTGLGLSTVWGLVQGQGGRIAIESAPGEGTTFHIRVPVAPAAAVAGVEDEGFEAVTGLRILVVDDEAAVRDFLPKLLEGHEVDVAASGGEGMEKFLKKRHDLVISDWVMAGMSGLDMAERIKQLAPRTVVVLMTGWEFKGSAIEKSSAIDLVVSKPFDREKLQRALQQAVGLREGEPSAVGDSEVGEG
jgi:CheY-like chemotaxis protein